MEVLSKSPEETKELAFRVASKLKKGDVLALYGDLGAGKTTFVRYLVAALGLEDHVQSPTFVLLRKYGFVNHLDFYRLLRAKEALNIGFEELIENSNSITVIEWPELLEDCLPERTIRLHFDYIGENERKITIQNFD